MGQEEHVRVLSVKMHAEYVGEGRTVIVFCWFKWGATNDYIQSPDMCTTSQYMQGYGSNVNDTHLSICEGRSSMVSVQGGSWWESELKWDTLRTINSECIKSMPVAEQLYSSFPRHTVTLSARPPSVSDSEQKTM